MLYGSGRFELGHPGGNTVLGSLRAKTCMKRSGHCSGVVLSKARPSPEEVIFSFRPGLLEDESTLLELGSPRANTAVVFPFATFVTDASCTRTSPM